MKKILTILILSILAVVSYGQLYSVKGLVIGAKNAASVPAGSSITVIDSIGVNTDDEALFFAGGDTLNAHTNIADQVPGSTLYPELLDTIPLTVFTLGRGLTADTALFDDDVIAGVFYNEGSDTLKITQLMGILAAGTGTETISVQISWHATIFSGSATSLNAAALAITSITTGTEDISFANSKIPPNVFVWCKLSGTSAGNRPSLLSVTLSGYKIPKY